MDEVEHTHLFTVRILCINCNTLHSKETKMARGIPKYQCPWCDCKEFTLHDRVLQRSE